MKNVPGSNTMSRMRNKLRLRPNINKALLLKECSSTIHNSKDNILSTSFMSTKKKMPTPRSILYNEKCVA